MATLFSIENFPQPTPDDLQIAPGIFIDKVEAENFMLKLEEDPELLPQMIGLWSTYEYPITRDNIDETIYDIYAPIFKYFAFQRRILDGDMQALQIAGAVEIHLSGEKIPQRVAIRHSIIPFAAANH